MESGHVHRPQAARSTGRPQYHGGRRGMRDEENEERTRERGGGEDSNSMREDKEKKNGTEETKREGGQIMAKSGGPKRCQCVCVFNLWVVANLGTMNGGGGGIEGWMGRKSSGCSSNRSSTGERRTGNNW